MFLFRNKEQKSPSIKTPSPRPISFSTRLHSSNSRSLSITENDNISTPVLISNTKRNSHENLINSTQRRSPSLSPKIIPPPLQRQISIIKTSKTENLHLTFSKKSLCFERKTKDYQLF